MTLTQLKKLEDAKSFDSNKMNAVGSGPQASQGSTTQGSGASQGFQFFHLILIALLSLIVGAIIAKSTSDTTTQESPDL